MVGCSPTPPSSHTKEIMKKLIIASILLSIVGAVSAEMPALTMTPSLNLSDANTRTAANSGSVAGANNQIGCLINCADQTNSSSIAAQAARDVASTTQTIKNTPSVSAPGLTTSNDTCMGSTSASVNIAGLGLGGGSSWVDTNCKLLKNSRELWNMGMKAAALALMCNDPANKEALELTGFICPQTEKHKESAVDKNYEPVTIKKAYYE